MDKFDRVGVSVSQCRSVCVSVSVLSVNNRIILKEKARNHLGNKRP